MLFRFSEVLSVLAIIATLLVSKHIPAFQALPLSQLTGIVCFAFAIFLCLRIYRAELARLGAED